TALGTSVLAVAAGGDHSHVLEIDGTAWSAGGNNYYGTIGDGSNTNRSSYVQVSGLTSITGLAAVTPTCSRGTHPERSRVGAITRMAASVMAPGPTAGCRSAFRGCQRESRASPAAAGSAL